jgi:hypothetical protein
MGRNAQHLRRPPALRLHPNRILVLSPAVLSPPHPRRQELQIAWSSDTATAFSQALEVVLFDDSAVDGAGNIASAFLPIAALAVDVTLDGTYELVNASKQKIGRLHAVIKWL